MDKKKLAFKVILSGLFLVLTLTTIVPGLQVHAAIAACATNLFWLWEV